MLLINLEKKPLNGGYKKKMIGGFTMSQLSKRGELLRKS